MPQFDRERQILAYSLRCLLRSGWWLVAVPALITAGVTAAQVLWREPLSDTLQITTGEIVGSLLAGFFGANLLDPEVRLRCGELLFSKPYPARRLIAGRVAMAMAAALVLVAVNAFIVGERRHLPYLGTAVVATIAPALFLCALACALFMASGNVIFAYIGPVLFWIWSTIGAPVGLRFDRLYNPIFQISAWSAYTDDPSAGAVLTLVGSNVALVSAALLLFWWCCRRVDSAVIQG